QLAQAIKDLRAEVVERRRTEAERAALATTVEQERATFAAVMASMGDGLVVMDSGPRIRFCNARAEDLLGVSREALVDRDLAEVYALIRPSMLDPDAFRDAAERWPAILEEKPSFEVRMGGPPQRDLQFQFFPV